jgi:hypothetical protein
MKKKQQLLKEGVNSAAAYLAKKTGISVSDLGIGGEWHSYWKYLVDIDPSYPNKKYLDWIVKYLIRYTQEYIETYSITLDLPFLQIMQDGAALEAKVLKRVLEEFHKFSEDRIIIDKESDIHSYSDLDGIETVVERARKHKQERIIRKYAKKDVEVYPETELILSTDSYYIVRPETRDSSIHYGKGTPWCIAGENNTYFNKYRAIDEYNIYMIIITNADVLSELEEIYEDSEARYNLTQMVSKVTILVDNRGSIKHYDGHFTGTNERFRDGIDPYLQHLQIDPSIFQPLTEEQLEEAIELHNEESELSADEIWDLEREAGEELERNNESEIERFLDDNLKLLKDEEKYSSHYSTFIGKIIDWLRENYEGNFEVEYSHEGYGREVTVSAYNSFDNMDQEDREDLIIEALYYLHELNLGYAEEWEAENPDKPKRPYIDVDTHGQQTLLEQLIRRGYRMRR